MMVVTAVVVARAMASRLAILEGSGHLDGVSVRIVHHLAPA